MIDTSLNYRNQRSERAIGQAIIRLMQAPKDLDRDEFVVCTKAGYLVRGAVPETLRPEDVVGGMHSMAPQFLADQLERSRMNLGLETIDVFYLHNPETQFGFVDQESSIPGSSPPSSSWRSPFQRERFNTTAQRLGKDSANRTRCPSPAWNCGTRDRGRGHHFRFIQLPYNLAMAEAFSSRHEENWTVKCTASKPRATRRHGRRECQHPAGESSRRTFPPNRCKSVRGFNRCAACDSVLAIGAGYHDRARWYVPLGTRT